MAVIFNRASAQIETHFELAKPDCYLADTQRAFCHLTAGLHTDRICRLGHGAALAAFGTVGVSANPGELAGWQFGFLQVARANNMSRFYSGRTRKEGSIGVQCHIPPALSSATLVDGDRTEPWIRYGDLDWVAPSLAGPVAKQGMSDHPTYCAEKYLVNDRTGFKNYLFHLITELEFWTSLGARDPAGNFQHFAHFHWLIRWEFRFVWHGNHIAIQQSNSAIRNDRPVAGLPSDPAVQALLNRPMPPFAIDEFNNANRNQQKNSPNRGDNPDWFSTMPAGVFL